MKKNLSNAGRVKSLESGLLLLVIIVYIIISIVLYKHYALCITNEKHQILQKQYTQIVNIINKKLSRLAFEFNQDIYHNNISISMEENYLRLCSNSGKCIKYSVSRLGALLKHNIAEYLYYEISLNKQFVHANAKFFVATLEKAYHINDNSQFNIALTISDEYSHVITTKVKSYLWVNISILAFTIINIIIFKRYYRNYYNEKYIQELDTINLFYKREIKDQVGALKKQIWSNDFKRQKDLEINNIFAQKIIENLIINNLALILEKGKESHNTIIPDINNTACTIVIHPNNKTEYLINIEQLIELFTNRFKDESNVTITIVSTITQGSFSSAAFLYQIIYSILKYLLFILDKQINITQRYIRLHISNVNNMISLKFEYNGARHESIEELLKKEYCFFKTHCNPFILNPSQILNLLKKDGFDYLISRAHLNTIKIYRLVESDNFHYTENKGNIIDLASFRNRHE